MADKSSNPRITRLADDVALEALSPLTQIEWDPETDRGSVTFDIKNYLKVNGQYRTTLGTEGRGALTVQLETVLGKLYGAGVVDPVTGADLHQVSGAGMALLIKAMFNEEFRENWQRQQYRPDLE